MSTETTKPTAARAFGYDQMHPGACCDCCNGYCGKSDWTPVPDEPMLRFTWAGREWISDRYLSIAAEELDRIPDTRTPASVKGMASRATGPATGLIGDRALALLGRLPRVEVDDSDIDTQHALVCDGKMIGFAMKGREGLPPKYLPRARRMAALLDNVGEESLVVAARAIVAWLDTEARA